MRNIEGIFLLILGVSIGAVAVYFLTRPKVAVSAAYTVRSYNNLEEWEIIKDKDGRVKGVKVHRDAKETA